ncbi:MAG TPA: serine hydrolase, partial [Acidimicrobiia bacterium]|nr:serine hydrolase [Acidimicrobiia bacterium]
MALAAAACTNSTSPAVTSTTPAVTSTTPPVSAAYGEECESFTVDPEHAFFAINDTYTDPDPVEWETAAPGDVGLDEAVLEEAAANAALSGDIASLLVVRDGKLVFERYFNGSDASQANNVHSLSKSILSLLTGLAIDDGTLELDSTIGELLPSELVGEHGDLTVENLLTMSGGLELSEQDEAHYEWEPSDEPGEPSFVRAVLERPSVTPPGSEFAYSTGLTQVLAAAVTEATGQSLCTFAAERLFGPLGIDVEKWWVETGGYFTGGHSLFLTPREVARVGQLVLQNGVWEGQKLVPSAWLEESLA